MKTLLINIFSLCKIRITLSVVLTSILGYILAGGNFDVSFFALLVGVFLLACGSSALNQTQEWYYDSLMQRTKNRPIPINFFSEEFGYRFSYLLIVLGATFLLYFGSNILPSILGIISVVFYNLIYTPLKRVSPFASVPGAVIGAIPPMIGWTYGGGYLLHPQNLIVSLFFFLWQVPHFWLLLLVYEDEYRQADFPVLTDRLNKLQIARISFIWIISMMFCGLAIPFLGNGRNYFSIIILFVIGLFFVYRFSKVFRIVQNSPIYKKAFIQLNGIVLFFIIIISLDKLINN